MNRGSPAERERERERERAPCSYTHRSQTNESNEREVRAIDAASPRPVPDDARPLSKDLRNKYNAACSRLA